MCVCIYRVSLDVFSVQAHEAPLWEDKVPKALFRGRDSRRERLNLCEISQNNSELVDAAITNYFFFRADEKKHGKKVKPISFMKFFDVSDIFTAKNRQLLIRKLFS